MSWMRKSSRDTSGDNYEVYGRILYLERTEMCPRSAPQERVRRHVES